MKCLYNYIKESLSQSRVFVVIKPGSLDLSQTIIERFKQDGWIVEHTAIKQLLLGEAKVLYQVHKNEPFYNDLCKYMSSDICRAFIFSKSGSKHPFEEVKSIKDEIRKEYGESDMRNVLHSSDSQENMDKEASLFFTKTW